VGETPLLLLAVSGGKETPIAQKTGERREPKAAVAIGIGQHKERGRQRVACLTLGTSVVVAKQTCEEEVKNGNSGPSNPKKGIGRRAKSLHQPASQLWPG